MSYPKGQDPIRLSRLHPDQIDRVAQEIVRQRGQDPFEIVEVGYMHDVPPSTRELWTYYLDDAAAYVRAAESVYVENIEPQPEPKWTGGPWRATRSDPSEGCDVWWIMACPASNQETDVATVSGGKWPPGKSEANARLVAAAPQLWDALSTLQYQLRVSWQAIFADGETHHADALRYALYGADAALKLVLKPGTESAQVAAVPAAPPRPAGGASC